MAISVLNTDAGLSGKTLVNAEDAQNVTGLKSFNRSPNAPFAVQAASAVVTNLDADKLDGLEASAFLKADGSTALTAGLQFPATQNASADANNLDDYEEGNWTPSLGGSATYTTQTGRYTKIGRMVHVVGHIEVNSQGTGSTGVVSGLPFTPTANIYPGSVGYFQGVASSFVFLTCYVNSGAATITFAGLTAAGATLSNPATVFQGSASVYFSAVYYV